MTQTIYGIKKFQAQLPLIARDMAVVGGEYVVTRRGEPAFVAMPYQTYQEMQDLLAELRSPQLQKDITQARKEHRLGKSIPIQDVISDLELE